ncbi:MAG TPA: type IX secretion system protein PorQ [Balneolales bacterium]|nr:type IX secretion system protein PorQ [Balneolales bacterium]
MRFKLSVWLILALLPVTAMSQSAIHSTYRFLLIPPSAYASALGGNGVSLKHGDFSMMTLNPAYISVEDHRHFALSYINHISDVNMGMLSGAWNFPGIGTLGGELRYLNYGKLIRADAEGNKMGTFQAYDMALSVAMSRNLMPHLRYAGGITFIRSSYGQYQSSAIGIMAGMWYAIPAKDLTLGASVTNLGAQIQTFDGLNEPLPLDIRVGVSKRLEHMPLRLSLTLHSLNRWQLPTVTDTRKPTFSQNLVRHVELGAELLLSDNVQIGLGYNRLRHEDLKSSNRLDLAGTSIGIIIRTRHFKFDISRNSWSSAGGLLQLSIQTTL